MTLCVKANNCTKNNGQIGAKIRANSEHFDPQKQITGQRTTLKLIKQKKQI